MFLVGYLTSFKEDLIGLNKNAFLEEGALIEITNFNLV